MSARCLFPRMVQEGAVAATADGRLKGTFTQTLQCPPIQALILMDSMRSLSLQLVGDHSMSQISQMNLKLHPSAARMMGDLEEKRWTSPGHICVKVASINTAVLTPEFLKRHRPIQGYRTLLIRVAEARSIGWELVSQSRMRLLLVRSMRSI